MLCRYRYPSCPASRHGCTTFAILLLALLNLLGSGCTTTATIPPPTPTQISQQPASLRDNLFTTAVSTTTSPTPSPPPGASQPTLSLELQERDAILEIAVFTSPGTPMPTGADPSQPAEQIRATRDSEHYRLTVAINDTNGYHTEQTNLTAEEWNSLSDIVIQHKLLDFRPISTAEQVADFGGRGFWIVGKRQNRQEWTRPLHNIEAPTVLMRHLAALVQDKLPQVQLGFLRPDFKPQ